MIFITGDIHGEIDISKLNSKKFPQGKLLSKSDYVIIAGDFGVIWDASKQEEYWLRWLSNKKFTTLFIDGNHENFNLLNSYPEIIWNKGKVHKISNSIFHLMRGQLFEFDEISIFTFGGAKSSDIEYRKENISWWKEEIPTQIEYAEGLQNLSNHNWEVDYIITHTCPEEIQDILKNKFGKKVESTELNKYFSKLNAKVSFRHWYFGHNHLDEKLTDRHTILYQEIIRII
jgi:DNA repair exonuclease SbcCD nuclease subunit